MVTPPELAAHPDYEFLGELGRGGMGVVYLVRHRLLDRKEVLKVLSKDLLQRPEAHERFLRELRSVAQLQHPNIVGAYAAVRLGATLAMAMEYVDGENLAQVVRASGPLSVTTACQYALQTALGLQHAHERGLVHRDIKPGNLVLVKTGTRATIKILDFGLAKLASEKGPDTDLTVQGQVLGTPDYMAPEQIRDAASADIRADIYSLGCTLYFLLTGRPPFRGANLYELFQAHQSADAAPVSSLRTDVPPALSDLIARLMAKGPAARFPTPAGVIKVLLPFTKPYPASTSAPGLFATQNPPGLVPLSETRPAVSGDTGVSPPRRPPPPPASGRATPKPPPEYDLSVVHRAPDRSAYLNPSDLLPPGPKTSVKTKAPKRKVKKFKRPAWLAPALIGGGLALLVLLGIVALRLATAETPTQRLAVDDRPRALGRDAEVPFPANPPPRAPEDPDEGFVPLFNGRDLTGFKTHPELGEGWRVENGILIGQGSRPTYLFTERGDYTNVHVRAKVRVNETGNSGVFVRTAYSARPGGTEAEISGFSHGVSNGKLLSGVLPISDPPALPTAPNQWFDLDFIVRGGQAETRVNGVVAASTTGPGVWVGAGHLALQMHSSQTKVEFAKLEVKRLPETPEWWSPTNVPDTPIPALAARSLAILAARSRLRRQPDVYRVEGNDLIVRAKDATVGWLTFGDPNWTDYDFSTSVMDTSGVASGTLFFRANHVYGKPTTDGQQGSSFATGLFIFGWWDNSTARLEAIDSAGNFINPEHFSPPSEGFVGKNLIRRNSWHTLKVQVRGEWVEGYLDGTRIVHGKVPMPARGCVGLRLWTDGEMRFRDFKVIDPKGKLLWSGLPEVVGGTPAVGATSSP